MGLHRTDNSTRIMSAKTCHLTKSPTNPPIFDKREKTSVNPTYTDTSTSKLEDPQHNPKHCLGRNPSPRFFWRIPDSLSCVFRSGRLRISVGISSLVKHMMPFSTWNGKQQCVFGIGDVVADLARLVAPIPYFIIFHCNHFAFTRVLCIYPR
jgi:hypothetical protein